MLCEWNGSYIAIVQREQPYSMHSFISVERRSIQGNGILGAT